MPRTGIVRRVMMAGMAVAACALVLPAIADAADIRILSPGATEGALSEILPQFEKATGHKTSIEYGPVGGLAARVAKGEAVDVVILSDAVADQLRDQGKTAAGSQVVIAKVGIGLFVRKGDPKPDIGTADAFRRALANAKVIAYGDPKLGGSASIVVAELLKSLDPTGSIAAKTRLVPPAKPLVDLVAAGGVDFGFQPISQIYLDPRIDYAGPLPSPYQYYTPYVASRVATSAQQTAYQALIDFLSTPESVAVWRSKGFEPR
jgi:molybdate transport system substrate-binding protein